MRLLGVAVAAVGLLVLAGVSVAAPAKEKPGDLLAVAPPAVPAKEFRGDVRSLKPVPVKKRRDVELRLPRSKKAPSGPVQAGLATPAAPNMPATIQNFAGLTFAGLCGATLCGAGWPPDPVGDVGPNHYVEAVNTSVGIFNKIGARLAAFTFDSLWNGAGSGTPCDTSNFGDPTVVYDQLSDRWIVADLGFNLDATGTTPVAPFYECIAVSKTGDPVSGGWYLYAVRADPGGSGAPPSGYLNDYPKMGLWQDGLYMTANEFDLNVASQPFKGVALWAFDRTAMEAGQPLKQLVAFTSNATNPVVSVLPVNLRGASAPAGTPEYLVSESTIGYAFEVRTFTVNWAAPSGVVSAPTNVSQAQYVIGAGDIVPQPADPFGTTGNLDAIDDRPMMQAQYRNLAGTESLWVAHTVRTSSSSPTGLQWAQLNVTGKTIATSPVQQQIFTNGGDGLWRWIPSLAVDGAGDMAIGYSTSSATDYPSIRYAGRLASDPANTLSQAETTLQTGLGSQTVSSRWGDYSAMTVDPTDNCTFWYVNEYYATPYDGTVLYAQWSTRIGSFKFPSCTTSPPPSDFSLAATPSSATTTAPGNASYSVAVSSLNGFSGTVGLSLGGLTSAQASWSFTPPTVANGSGSSQLAIVTASALQPGSYPLTISGTSGAVTHTTQVTLVVNPSPDFTLGVSPSTVTVKRPHQSATTVSVGSLGGFSSAVTLSVSALPSGVTGSFSTNPVTPGGQSTLTLHAARRAQTGTFTITITGTSGTKTHTASATLTVS